ncbi:aminotransferase class V-fold PLP-dependent enzyme [Streptomyces nitrosporeus]|uniref:Aminotransferase class V-fold PLP-dependent enzyme n=1 Tax=Streptomyces nitrosporeus TaxID=28894 RepID=A0A5J6FL37_9ACTN|nr:aminotransferase class V-fold PLP-dependent enzyme [Streptomyces nitrosporeus]QEU76796.1 aminotransferase class V-fold PLP-dependent enzyme [Streptomyces nitrosporeus]
METSAIDRARTTEFAPDTVYLNTSSCGLLPRGTVDAVTTLAEENALGRRPGGGDHGTVAAARDGFARFTGTDAGRVAVGGSVAGQVALVAASLPAGSEVLAPEGEFSSVVSPFAQRGNLKMRYVPLAGLADAVRPDTALVAFSAVQSSDGRVAGLEAVREAAAAYGARTLLDASQAAGWLPLDTGAYDYTVTGAFKFLLCPRGTTFLTVTEEAQETLPALHAGLLSAQDPDAALYGPVQRLADEARRFDEPVSFLSYAGAAHSLALLDGIGVDTLHAHATGLAARFRAGLAGLGHEAVPGDSAVVAVPGLGSRQPVLARAGIVVSQRAGNLRAAFHLYNTEADVDRALDVLSG